MKIVQVIAGSALVLALGAEAALAAPQAKAVSVEVFDAATGKVQRIAGRVTVAVGALGMPISLTFNNGKPICNRFVLTFRSHQDATFSTVCGGKRYTGSVFFNKPVTKVADALAGFKATLKAGKNYIKFRT